MAEACYTARATTKQQVIKGIGKLTLRTNKHWQYTHNAILLLQKGIRCMFVSQFNPSNPGKGMEKLLEDGSNLLTNVKSTDAITANSVLKAAKTKADPASKAASTTIAPTITSQLEAQEEADRLNVINQLVVSAKEGVVEAATKLVGSNITDAVLQTADGSNHKSIDNYMLFVVMTAAIDGTDQPFTTNVLEQLLEVINHTFDFQKKVNVNMELMQSNVERMATYGIAISIPQLTLMLTANIKNATKAEYGHKFQSAMQAICKKYTYNHVHDATLLQDIMKELAGADGVCELKDAPAPRTGTVHSVADSVSYLQAMMDADTDTEHSESAYAATSDSDLSKEMRKPHGRDCKSKSRHGGCEKDKKGAKKQHEKNTCLHCKKFHRTKPHRVSKDKCMWNKKYKGYQFKSICDKLEVAFKPHHKFTADLEGYAEQDSNSSGSN
jgi:hypothetical protein